jgi:phospho-N-acetylmuramoyl-pentapeptide-transferase
MDSLVAVFVAMILLTALPGRAVIGRLRGLGARQTVSQDAPAAHSAKQGTPTMGALMFLAPFVVIILGILALRGRERADPALAPVFLTTIAFAGIGFLDDYLKAKRGKNLGLTSRQKFVAQCIVAIGFVLWLARTAQPVTTQVELLPARTGVAPLELGWLYYALAVLFLVGLSNATNFADGLDGLAAGLALLICGAAAALVWLSHPQLSLLTVALAGGLAGFLWWNAHPARVFMGDTGSLALGAALACVALAGKQEIPIIVASLVCWAELISAMVQVSVFKWRKRTRGIEYARANRVFRRTPLHHHFEELGVPETAIVTRFWIAGALAAALALLWARSGYS